MFGNRVSGLLSLRFRRDKVRINLGRRLGVGLGEGCDDLSRIDRETIRFVVQDRQVHTG